MWTSTLVGKAGIPNPSVTTETTQLSLDCLLPDKRQSTHQAHLGVRQLVKFSSKTVPSHFYFHCPGPLDHWTFHSIRLHITIPLMTPHIDHFQALSRLIIFIKHSFPSTPLRHHHPLTLLYHHFYYLIHALLIPSPPSILTHHTPPLNPPSHNFVN